MRASRPNFSHVQFTATLHPMHESSSPVTPRLPLPTVFVYSSYLQLNHTIPPPHSTVRYNKFCYLYTRRMKNAFPLWHGRAISLSSLMLLFPARCPLCTERQRRCEVIISDPSDKKGRLKSFRLRRTWIEFLKEYY